MLLKPDLSFPPMDNNKIVTFPLLVSINLLRAVLFKHVVIMITFMSFNFSGLFVRLRKYRA